MKLRATNILDRKNSLCKAKWARWMAKENRLETTGLRTGHLEMKGRGKLSR